MARGRKSRVPDTRRVIAVVWHDAVGADDDDDGELRPIKAITYGEPIEINDEHVKLAGESFEDGTARQYTSIPRAMIEKVFQLRMPDPFKEMNV